MRLSIYISGNELSYTAGELTGKGISVGKAGRILLPEDTMINGEIQNAGTLKDALGQMRKQEHSLPKKADVVLSNDAVLTKLLEVPLLSRKKILKVVREEMRGFVDAEESYVYDYSVLNPRLSGKKAGRILCAVMNREALNQYRRIFQECKMEIGNLDVAMRAQVRMTGMLGNGQEKTFIVAVLENHNLYTSLYVKGDLIYNSSSSVSERDGLGLISEMTRVLSGFIQFNQSQKNDTDVEHIYICGLHKDEEGFCRNVTNTLGIKTMIFPGKSIIRGNPPEGYSVQGYIYATGNLLRKQV